MLDLWGSLWVKNLTATVNSSENNGFIEFYA